MKTILTISLFLTLLAASGQPNYTFPLNNANWHEVTEFPTGSFPNFGLGMATFQYQYDGIKVIGDLTYGQLFSTESPMFVPGSTGNVLQGYVREENDVVMLLRFGQSREDTLYNFNLQPGDTATFIKWCCGNNFPMIVNTVDSLLINNEYRRRILFDTVGAFELELAEVWIEGIGSIHGPLFPAITRLFSTNVPDGSYLSCFSQNNQLVYHSEKYVTCYNSTSKGDANCDGDINVLDVITMVNNILGFNPQPFCYEFADVNGDGLINVLDVVATIGLILEN